MGTFFIFIFTLFLLGLCVITILFILMQRPSEESGMGATLGGGAVTSILGGEGINTLAKITKYCIIFYFCLSLFLSMLHISREKVDRPRNLLEKKVVAEAIVGEASGEIQKDTVPKAEVESVSSTEKLAAETENISVETPRTVDVSEEQNKKAETKNDKMD
ncbi:MAG: preprotein translocase subunit SecG [Puniceicoccales bacterium]|jgi:protein translocase SecG subunit|nr:preprotein translocase subunit SecG [Puniceicoccales bacterium]